MGVSVTRTGKSLRIIVGRAMSDKVLVFITSRLFPHNLLLPTRCLPYLESGSVICTGLSRYY